MTDSTFPLPAQFTSRALLETLEYEPVDPTLVRQGSPSTGNMALGNWHGLQVGIWEMTPGSMVDVEVDEVFIVISGEATLTRTIEGREVKVELSPGVVGHLEAGEHTLWDVRVALRKIYLVR